MPNTVTPEMVRLLNGGDRRELRAFLTLYARPVYERALAITCDEIEAKRVTRRVISETAMLAAKGALEEDVDAQLMRLTDACCSEDLFFARLVDDTMKELSTSPAGGKERHDAPKKSAQEIAEEIARDDRDERNNKPAPAEPVRMAAPAALSADQPPAFPRPPEAQGGMCPPYVSDLAVEPEENVPDLFAEDDEEEPEMEEGKKPGPLIVVLIFTLALITMALVWVLIVKLMCLGVIPKYDFGFADWFNAHLFRLY